MKTYGKVTSFDNYNGEITDKEGDISLLLSENLNSDNLNVGDYVSFVKEKTSTLESNEQVNIAYFVKKIEKQVNHDGGKTK